MNTKGHLTVSVTADDIARGERRCADKCPIALAIKRVSECEDVSVEGGMGLLLRAKGTSYDRTWVGVDRETRSLIDDFIAMFDEGDDVEEVVFEIKIDEDRW